VIFYGTGENAMENGAVYLNFVRCVYYNFLV